MKLPAFFRVKPLHLRYLSLWASAAALLGPACVDLSPPWQGAQDAGVTSTGGSGGAQTPLDSGGTAGDDGGIAAADAPVSGRDSAPDVGGFVLDVSLPDRALDIPNSGSGGSAYDGASDSRLGEETGGDTGGKDGSGGTGGSAGSGGTSAGSGGTSAGSGGTSAGSGGTSAGSGGTSAGSGGSSTGGAGGTDVGPSDGGLSNGLVAHYSCENSTGNSLPDLSGHNHDAVLVTGAGGTAGYKFATGKVGNALDFASAQQGYATLPSNLLTGATEATVATWVYLNSNPAWQRIFDFGRDSTYFMYLTTSNGITFVPGFSISVVGSTASQTVSAQTALPTGTWKHIAIVLGPSGGILYVDGVQVGANTDMTLRPADLGSSLDYYIGRSEVSADPYLDGNVDEFRVYNRALSPSEIQTLASGS